MALQDLLGGDERGGPGRGVGGTAGMAVDHRTAERLEQWLIQTEHGTKTEIIVVTIRSLQDYPGSSNSSIEAFATGLFNTWGIGNRPKNDGILPLATGDERPATIAVIGVLGGILGRDGWLGRQVARRQARMLRELPTLADLLCLAVTAGEGPRAALERAWPMEIRRQQSWRPRPVGCSLIVQRR